MASNISVTVNLFLMGYIFQEIKFEQSVRQNIYEERQNQLCWQVKLGDEIMSSKQRFQVLDTRKVNEIKCMHVDELLLTKMNKV